ncbi:MAG: F0F1 ATP synthase subunit B [Alphaproteobacteria bacterium]|nr:F0F1 ATP synthase subunit B [Alphaproteobacteria bacterium]
MKRSAWRIGWSLPVVALAIAPSAAFAAGAEGGLPQLDVTTFPTQIFWLIVSFTVLYIFMSKIVVPRIADVLEERQDRIADDLETAERFKGEAEGVKAEYEQTLADSREKAQALFRETHEMIVKEHAAAEAEAARKTAVTTKEAETRIAKEKDGALENLRAVASDAATAAMTKLTGISVDDTAVGKAVDAAMTQRGA